MMVTDTWRFRMAFVVVEMQLMANSSHLARAVLSATANPVYNQLDTVENAGRMQCTLLVRQ